MNYALIEQLKQDHEKLGCSIHQLLREHALLNGRWEEVFEENEKLKKELKKRINK